MTNGILLFSVVMGSVGTTFTDNQLEARKKAIRQEVITLIPAIRYLMHTTIEERVYIDNEQLILGFFLMESHQKSFIFESGRNKANSSMLAHIARETEALRQSAEYSQIRISELANLASQLTTTADDGSASLDLSPDDEALWMLMHSSRGKSIRFKFNDSDLLYQLPNLPYFQAEQTIRSIRATVSSATSSSADLVSVTETSDDDTSQCRASLPKRLRLLRANAKDWPLLYAALDCHIDIEAEVRVALWAHNQSTAHLELVRVINADDLTSAIGIWLENIHRRDIACAK